MLNFPEKKKSKFVPLSHNIISHYCGIVLSGLKNLYTFLLDNILCINVPFLQDIFSFKIQSIIVSQYSNDRMS